MNDSLQLQLPRLAGRFTMTVSGGRRGSVVLADFENIITDTGLNDIFASSAGNGAARCQLGTGTATPTASDAALAVPGPASTTVQRLWGAELASYVAGPPDYVSDFITIRFPTGTATGTWTEVAMTRSSPTTFFSRALIVDGGGSPTPITVLSDEQLDVTYTGRVYPPASDVTGTINLGLSTHDYIIRPSLVNNGASWAPNCVFYSRTYAGFSGAVTSGITLFDGTIGARTASPSGASTTHSYTQTPAAYSNNSMQREFEIRFDLNQGNVAGGGIRSMRFNPRYAGSGGATPGLEYQVEFTPKIAKDNTKVLRLNFVAAFARR